MQHEFWQARWARNEIGFHQQKVNPGLERQPGNPHLAPVQPRIRAPGALGINAQQATVLQDLHAGAQGSS